MMDYEVFKSIVKGKFLSYPLSPPHCHRIAVISYAGYCQGYTPVCKTCSQSGKPLEGVMFELRNKEGRKLDTLVTDKTGCAETGPSVFHEAYTSPLELVTSSVAPGSSFPVVMSVLVSGRQGSSMRG